MITILHGQWTPDLLYKIYEYFNSSINPRSTTLNELCNSLNKKSGNKTMMAIIETSISITRFIFCCHDGNRPECISIKGSPITLLVCIAPLIISNVSGVILMFTSLSLRSCKMRVIKSRSFFSTAIITSSIFLSSTMAGRSLISVNCVI